jgi:hypothetical protein
MARYFEERPPWFPGAGLALASEDALDPIFPWVYG